MGIKSGSIWCVFLVLALVFMLHVKAREVPKPKNIDSQNEEGLVVPLERNTTLVNNNTGVKDAPKKGGDEVNDDKHFIAFAGMGAAGGVGKAIGIIPIDFNGLGTLPTFGGGGLGGGGGVGGGCPTTSTGGGLVPIVP